MVRLLAYAVGRGRDRSRVVCGGRGAHERAVHAHLGTATTPVRGVARAARAMQSVIRIVARTVGSDAARANHCYMYKVRMYIQLSFTR